MNDTPHPPGYAALRRFRESQTGAEYFLTLNLTNRGRGLEAPLLTGHVIRQWLALETDGVWLVRTGVVMPNHVHLLVRLGDCLPLAECLRLYKGRLAPRLRDCNLHWQAGFYEHRMRTPEDVRAVFFYVYLNPYRARLLAESQAWPGYFCHADDWKWFGGMTRKSAPQPEWLR
jgi:REP element-mobilizing transposase RayT